MTAQPGAGPAAQDGRTGRPPGAAGGAGARVELLHGLGALQAVEDLWQDCYALTEDATPFASPDWALSWLRHYSTPERALALVVRDGLGIVALLPLHRRDVAGVRVLSLAGGDQSDYQDISIRPGGVDWPAVARRLSESDCFDVLDLRQVPVASALHGLAAAWPRRHLALDDAPTSRLLLRPAEGAEDLARRRSSGFAKKVRQAERRAAQRGLVVAERPVTAEDVADVLRFHRLGWQDRGMNPEHATDRFLRHLQAALPG